MTDKVEFSGDGDDREDLTPGGDLESPLTGDVDPETDYEGATETWIGEPATVELSIETLDGIDVKQFALEEPDNAATMDQIFRGIMNDDRHAVCDALVREPALSDESGEPNDVWREKLTGRERSLLFDHALAWVRAGDYVDMQAALEASDVSEW